MESFRQALRQLGFVEGKNVAIELRYATGGLQQPPELAAGAGAPEGGRSPDLWRKEIVPGISRVAALWDPTTGASQVALTERAERSMNLHLQVLEVRRRDDVLAVARQGTAALMPLTHFSSPFLASLFREIIVLSAEYRLPAIYQWKEHVEAGGLVSFRPNLAAMFRQTGTIVVKILKGAKPAELPVEQPTKFEQRLTFSAAVGTSAKGQKRTFSGPTEMCAFARKRVSRSRRRRRKASRAAPRDR
jgi:hypothetical protein